MIDISEADSLIVAVLRVAGCTIVGVKRFAACVVTANEDCIATEGAIFANDVVD